MKVEYLLLRLEPVLHLGAFVGAVVVHDEMHFLIDGELIFEMIQENSGTSRTPGCGDIADKCR
jgi:hypothetical protein